MKKSKKSPGSSSNEGIRNKIKNSGEYADESLWYEKDDTGALLGITSLSAERLGDVEDLILPEEGDRFVVGDVILTIQGNQSEVDLIAPAPGVITEVNAVLSAQPGLLNDDPTGEGWIVRFDVEDFEVFADFIEGDGGFTSRYSEEGGPAQPNESPDDSEDESPDETPDETDDADGEEEDEILEEEDGKAEKKASTSRSSRKPTRSSSRGTKR